MKETVKHCLATTGLSLLLLAVIAQLYQATFLCVETIFQVFCANLLIHLGFLMIRRLEFRYFMIEISAELGYLITILFLFGQWFHWYSSTPPWVLLLLGAGVYLIGGAIGLFRLHSDLDAINKQLEQRRLRLQKGTNEEGAG